MKYRNTKTGAVIDVKAELGGDWMPVETKKKAEPSPEAKKKKAAKK